MRPFLFMIGEKDKLRSETTTAISQMMIESKETSPLALRTSKVLVSGDTMQIDQSNVTINFEDIEDIEDKCRPIEEEKRLLEEEKKKI